MHRLTHWRQLDFTSHRRRELTSYSLELFIIVIAAVAYAGVLLDMNPTILQGVGEHNESAVRPLIAEIGLVRYGEIPLWNPYVLTGLPMAGDLLGHFWSPIATIPVYVLGGINGMKVSVFLSYLLAGLGMWYLARVCGLRGLFRVWASLIFMFSGGLALLWRLGWYELLLGVAWFPWAFASFWQALHSTSLRSLAWAALCSAMVLLPGGGYYPFYLTGSLLVIFLAALLWAKTQRRHMIKRALVVALLTGGLIAVMALPIIDGYRLIVREAGADVYQRGSQPMIYAVLNYVISDPEWFANGALGTSGGYNWFYLGALTLVFLLFAPLSQRRYRRVLITMTLLFFFLLIWHANRYFPGRLVYDAVPFLYQLRFPNRLLYVAAIPLIILSSAGFQTIYYLLRRRLAAVHFGLKTPKGTFKFRGRAGLAVTVGAVVIAFLSVQDVYSVNQPLAFSPTPLDTIAYQVLAWLKYHDPGTYYSELGPGIYWWRWWMPIAIQLEMPVLNYHYNQHLRTQNAQQAPESPITATPKYKVRQTQDEAPAGGKLILDHTGIRVWQMPVALPFAFTTPHSVIGSGEKLTTEVVTEVQAHYAGTNHIIATVNSSGAQPETLVVLVSHYPGWRVQIDGQPASLAAANDYLGVPVLPGEHTYTFEFDPPLHQLGAIISGVTLIVVVFMLRSTRGSRYL